MNAAADMTRRQHMVSTLAAVALAFGNAATVSAATDSAPAVPMAKADQCRADVSGTPSPVALYGPEIEFEVLRDDRPVGRHVTRFERSGPYVTATSEMTLEVDVLFFTAYRFSYFAKGRWCGDRLWALSARRDDNGDVTEVRAYHDGDTLVVDSADRHIEAPPDIVPTNHWYAGVVRRDAVLNTLTGGINHVDIVEVGRERVTTGAGRVSATRYSYTGDLTTDLWYDDAGRWVKLEFEARDGSTITYRCRRCGTADNPRAEPTRSAQVRRGDQRDRPWPNSNASG